jgi:putative ABC transport system permease protein
LPILDSVPHDLRYTLRGLRRSPGFAIVAVLTLALGIGGATAMFAIVHAVLLKPLPYGNADRLLEISEVHPARGEMAVRAADFASWRHDVHAFDRTTAFFWYDATFTGGDRSETVVGEHVLEDFFGVLGANPALGRTFTAADYRVDASNIVVLSDRVWRRRFGPDPSIIGRSISVDQAPQVVIGVMPPEFWRPFDVEVWSPWLLTPAQWRDRRIHQLIALATLRPSVTVPQARAELASIYHALAYSHPDDRDWSAHITRYRDSLVGASGTMLRLLFGGVITVLLISCANVASLMLAHVTTRERELAIRRALGATRRQVMSLLLVEAALLAAAGGGLGLLMAVAGVPWMGTLTAKVFPALLVVPSVDGRVLMFTTGTAAIVVLLCGLVPALTAGRAHAGVLTSVRASAGAATTRARATLVVLEVAGAVTLVTLAGLMVESYVRLAHVHLGFDPVHLLTASVRLPHSRYPDRAHWLAFQQRAVEELRSLPGVDVTAAADHLPGTEFSGNVTFSVNDTPAQSLGALSAHFVDISPTFFRALGAPLVTGRAFSDADGSNAAGVVIVNQALARQVWSGKDPLGRVLHVQSGLNKDFRVVGLLPDVQMGPLHKGAESVVYFPFAQAGGPDLVLILRAASDFRALPESTTRALNALDPQLTGMKVRPMDDILADGKALPRAGTWWFASFSGFALTLAALGVYGLLAFVVGRRAREIGIRMALGADRRMIARLVLTQAYTLGLAGVTLGAAAATVASRMLQSVLFQTNASNPITLFVTVTVLLAVVGAASYLPTHRATHVDPGRALRCE